MKEWKSNHRKFFFKSEEKILRTGTVLTKGPSFLEMRSRPTYPTKKEYSAKPSLLVKFQTDRNGTSVRKIT